MTKKRLSKLLMSKGLDRNTVTDYVKTIRKTRQLCWRMFGESALIAYEEVVEELSTQEGDEK